MRKTGFPMAKVPPIPKPKQDNVNNPSHYTSGLVQCIDAIQSALTPEEFKGYLKGNVFKYNWRSNHKGGVEDLKKAAWYQTRLISQFE